MRPYIAGAQAKKVEARAGDNSDFTDYIRRMDDSVSGKAGRTSPSEYVLEAAGATLHEQYGPLRPEQGTLQGPTTQLQRIEKSARQNAQISPHSKPIEYEECVERLRPLRISAD